MTELLAALGGGALVYGIVWLVGRFSFDRRLMEVEYQAQKALNLAEENRDIHRSAVEAIDDLRRTPMAADPGLARELRDLKDAQSKLQMKIERLHN